MIKIISVVTKSPDWKKATLQNEAGATFPDVSINAVSKKGEPFPNFANLAEGQEVDGILWESPKGPWYLFPPKPVNSSPRGSGGSTGAYKTKQITEAMDTKARNIAEAQDRSAWMWSKTNAATLLAGHDSIRGVTPNGIVDIMIGMATKIYNAEPIEPFSTPPKRTPDERVPESDRNIRNEDITFDQPRDAEEEFRNYPN